MAVYNEGPTKTLKAAGTIGRYERVKIDANGDWAQAGAGAGGKGIGIALDNVTVGQFLSAYLLNRGGTVKMKAAVAIAKGALVYGGAAGKVNVTNTNCLEGMAVEASTADNDIIEVAVMNTSAVTL
jgi:hypothetical protein